MLTPLEAAERRPGASSRQLAAMEDELRRMVARELHDRVAQTLTGMLVEVENFKSQQVGWDDVLKQMDMVQSSTRQVLNNLRQLLLDLRGEEQVAAGLPDALSELVVRFAGSTSIETELEIKPGWPESLTAPASLNLYRIVEEAMTNVRLHSGARKVAIVLEPVGADEVAVVVRDDGRGLDTSPTRPVGMGTVGMKERAVFLGGKLSVESGDGSGTTVRAVFPRSLIVPEEAPRRLSLAVGMGR